MWSLTPLYIRIWVLGFGLLPGAFLGAVIGFAVAFFMGNLAIAFLGLLGGVIIGTPVVYLFVLAALLMIGGVSYVRTR